MKVLNTCLKKKGMELDSGFSIVMPNNYIIMVDVDSKEVGREKLTASEAILKHINKVILERKRGIFEVEKGVMPGVLTSVINPFFNKNAVDTNFSGGRQTYVWSCT